MAHQGSFEDKERRAKEIKEFKEVFALFDKNSDGTISTVELGGILKGLHQEFSEKQLEAMIRKVDINGDGQIDFDEFLLMMDGQIGANRGKSEVDELADAFRVFDKDGNGEITSDELYAIFQSLGQNIDRETINLMISTVDTNGDGTISFQEFRKMMLDGPT